MVAVNYLKSYYILILLWGQTTKDSKNFALFPCQLPFFESRPTFADRLKSNILCTRVNIKQCDPPPPPKKNSGRSSHYRPHRLLKSTPLRRTTLFYLWESSKTIIEPSTCPRRDLDDSRLETHMF